ncbi:zinc finger MYND domain-containing protein 11 isoform X2 [Anthonomus grandis grandis]|uniref:zinc finger MYND domain-containing protein 11 isoform X2 n=1 Tax=Anthonomus grandis grandis TaxID=2921223 RepID=UPI002165166C|nr:zinc finger MYND domain-containing protein 11 isoform X2 [Anthonomus grandis grandis]
MPIRRHCDPINVKRIWDAIRSVNVTKQQSDITRITHYLMKNEKCTQQQVELYLKQCVSDKLIMQIKKNGADGPIFVYKITEQELPEFDGKDWYCFECHLAGEVNVCANNCFRVFHSDCIQSAKKKFHSQKSSSLRFNSTSNSNIDQSLEASDILLNESRSSSGPNQSLVDYTFDETLCTVCNIVNIDGCDLEQAEMNYLLKFVLHRIRAWLPNTITHTMAEEDRPSWLTDSELTWRANQLFFEHRDMSVIEVNLNTDTYKRLSDFLADILTVEHNVAVFHGIDSQEYQAAELMVRDTQHDLTELKNCTDCYKHSNEKINPLWFALPCRKPHDLVWAKQKGYPYWPAKVIKETPFHCDVRFFGGKHERALIHKSFVKPITTTKESLKIKPSLAFTKSLEELIYHQKLLRDPHELNKFLSDSKSKKTGKKSLSPVEVVKPITPKKKGKQPVSQKTPVTSRASTSANASGEPRSRANSHASKRKSSLTASETSDSSRSRSKKPKGEHEPEKASENAISGNVIDISDCEDDDETEQSFRGNNMSQDSFRFDESYEQVSSSTENEKNGNREAGLHQLDQPYSDSVEKMRRTLEALTGKGEIIKSAMDHMQSEIDRIINDNNDHLKRLFDSHNAQISETKKKQWCYNCEQDAIYHCCWNTAYCSQTCQQQHWQAEHKKVCRRKRQA